MGKISWLKGTAPGEGPPGTSAKCIAKWAGKVKPRFHGEKNEASPVADTFSAFAINSEPPPGLYRPSYGQGEGVGESAGEGEATTSTYLVETTAKVVPCNKYRPRNLVDSGLMSVVNRTGRQAGFGKMTLYVTEMDRSGLELVNSQKREANPFEVFTEILANSSLPSGSSATRAVTKPWSTTMNRPSLFMAWENRNQVDVSEALYSRITPESISVGARTHFHRTSHFSVRFFI